jgi:hypothetical protein
LFEQQQKRLGPAFVVAFAYHVAMLLFIIFAIRYGPGGTTSAALLPEQPNHDIVWLNEPGPGGGGGGGGNKMPEPPRKAELPGKEKLTVPVEKPPKLEPQQTKKDPAGQQLNIPADSRLGLTRCRAIEAPVGPPTCQGPAAMEAPARHRHRYRLGHRLWSGAGIRRNRRRPIRPGNGVSLPKVVQR